MQGLMRGRQACCHCASRAILNQALASLEGPIQCPVFPCLVSTSDMLRMTPLETPKSLPQLKVGGVVGVDHLRMEHEMGREPA